MEKVTGSNQGESSNQTPNDKRPYLGDWGVQNREGAQSGLSETAGLGAVSAAYVSPSGTTGINGTASMENLSAKFKAPNVSDDAGAGVGQYQ